MKKTKKSNATPGTRVNPVTLKIPKTKIVTVNETAHFLIHREQGNVYFEGGYWNDEMGLIDYRILASVNSKGVVSLHAKGIELAGFTEGEQ